MKLPWSTYQLRLQINGGGRIHHKCKTNRSFIPNYKRNENLYSQIWVNHSGPILITWYQICQLMHQIIPSTKRHLWNKIATSKVKKGNILIPSLNDNGIFTSCTQSKSNVSINYLKKEAFTTETSGIAVSDESPSPKPNHATNKGITKPLKHKPEQSYGSKKHQWTSSDFFFFISFCSYSTILDFQTFGIKITDETCFLNLYHIIADVNSIVYETEKKEVYYFSVDIMKKRRFPTYWHNT
jgi:hypothetical protein